MSKASCAYSLPLWLWKHSQPSGTVRLRNYFNVMNYVKMQLDPGLLIVSIRNFKIKLNYPHGDNGWDHDCLLISPSFSYLSTLTLLSLTRLFPLLLYCLPGAFDFPSSLYKAAMTLLCGSNDGFITHGLHGQLRSGGTQAVRSFTFARSPSLRSATIH